MRITCDAAKREANLVKHGLDLMWAREVFQKGPTIDFPDLRKDYREQRFVSVGHLRGRMVVAFWIPVVTRVT